MPCGALSIGKMPFTNYWRPFHSNRYVGPWYNRLAKLVHYNRGPMGVKHYYHYARKKWLTQDKLDYSKKIRGKFRAAVMKVISRRRKKIRGQWGRMRTAIQEWSDYDWE